MARRILTLLLILIFTLTLCMDYEVIKNSDGDRDIISIYLNNNEVLSLIGDDTETFEKAYSFIAKLIQYSYLQYDVNQIRLDKAPGLNYVLFWEDKVLLHLSQDEKDMNDRRRNGLDEIRLFIKSINKVQGQEKIEIYNRKLSIRDVNKIKIVSIKQPSSAKCFPAIHRHLPLGTKVRIINPETDWSVVVQVVRNEDLGLDNLIGLPEQAANAIGIKETGQVMIKTQIL